MTSLSSSPRNSNVKLTEFESSQLHNIWNKIKKSSRIEHYHTLIFAFAYFLIAFANGHMSPSRFEIFVTFPNFLSSLVLNGSVNGESHAVCYRSSLLLIFQNIMTRIVDLNFLKNPRYDYKKI